MKRIHGVHWTLGPPGVGSCLAYIKGRTIRASDWGLLYYNALKNTNATSSEKKGFIHKSSKSRQPYIGLIFIFNAAGGSWESEPIIITELLLPSKFRRHRDRVKETEDLFWKHSSISTVLCSFWHAEAVKSETCFYSTLYDHGHLWMQTVAVEWILKFNRKI